MVVWTLEPAVAVTVTCDVPTGVVVVVVLILELLWLQPTAARVSRNAAIKLVCSSHSLESLRRRRKRSNPRLAPPVSIASEVVPCGVPSGFLLSDAAFTLVVMVSMEVELLVPFAVTDAGLNVQVVFAGRPEHVKFTAWLNPPEGVTARVDVTELPWLTEPLEGVRVMLKSAAVDVIVMARMVEDDAAFAVSPP